MLFGFRGALSRRLEFDHIDAASVVKAPAYRLVIGRKKRTLDWHGAAQMMEQLTQVGAGLGLARLRPQQKGEVFAGVRRIAVQDQKSQ